MPMISIPFSGSKRYSYKNVKKIVEAEGYRVIHEPFGGSCVLSVNLYNDGLINRAIVNDYDYFFDSYPEYLNRKDEIISICLEHGLKKDGKRKLCAEHQAFLQKLITETNPKLWRHLACNFVFSGQRSTCTLKPSDFRYFMNDLNTDRERKYYEQLQNLEIVHYDYREYFKNVNIENDDLLILDPPYLNSAQRQYDHSLFFSLADTIELLKIVKELKNDFIFFNLIERDTVALLKLFDFKITEKTVKSSTSFGGIRREEVMTYIKRPT